MNNRLYYAFVTYAFLICGYLDDTVWVEDTVDDVTGQGDFAVSEVWLIVDRWGYPHIEYGPYCWDIDNYRLKYAYQDSSGWHTEFVNDKPEDTYWVFAVVDSLGIAHAAKSDPTGVYHMVHYPGSIKWHQLERIDTFSRATDIQIAIDDQDFLHVAFTNNDRTKLIYATTNPDIGVWEASPAEPRQNLILSMTPSGFLISGYEGPVQVYDATGRLLLSREIEGKTLIGPLNPGCIS